MRYEKKRMLAAHLILSPWLVGAFLRRGGFARTCSKINPDVPHGGLPLTSKLERHGHGERFVPTERVQTGERTRLNAPYVIKPEYGRASRDVTQADELPDSPDEPLVVQEYRDGIEYAINIDTTQDESVYRVIEIHPEGDLWTGDATYVDRTDAVTEELQRACVNACREVDLCFGRLDVKADSLQALLKGDFAIIEVNGALSVDLKCYETESFKDTITAIRSHWQRFFNAADTSKAQSPKDTPVLSYFVWLLLQPVRAASHLDEMQSTTESQA